MSEKKSTTVTAMPYEWDYKGDDNELKPKSGQQVTGDAKRVAKECHFTMDLGTLDKLKTFVKGAVSGQLASYRQESDIRDLTSINNLKATTNALNAHYDKIIAQLQQMKNDTADNVLDGFERTNSEKGKRLMETTKKNQKVLEELVAQSGKQTVDLDKKMNIFITGKAGVLSGSSDYERTKKEKYLGVIDASEHKFSGTLYIPKTFGVGEPLVLPGTIKQINSKKREYVIVYTDEKNKTHEKTVTKICQQL